MDTVKKEMEKSYGSSKDSITRYELYQSLGDDQLPEYTYKKADQLAVWSGESLKDAIPSDKSTEYETAWEAFLEFHMARSNIEMQRKRNRDGVLNSYYEIRKP